MNDTRWVMSSLAALLLCACNGAHPPQAALAANAPQAASPAKPQKGAEAAADTAFKEHVVIKPSESVEKDQIQVSYSLKPVPNEANALLLSLTFRNLRNKNVRLHPHIVLSDAENKPIPSHTRHSFIAEVKLEAARASGTQTDPHARMEEKIKWANRFWLKERFTIPANGIEVGEMVFHCKTACQPRQLNVMLGKQVYPFDITAVAR